MSLEELWKLFPITLSEHKSYWADWYAEEVNKLKAILPFDVELHHIGSTAICGIKAKPIVDILIVVDSADQMNKAADIMQEHGRIIMSRSPNRISLNCGYTEKGFAERVFHYHIRLKGDTDEIYFRDYLNSHNVIAKEYESLKMRLCELYKYNRDAYTQAKTDFVKKYTEAAKYDSLK